MGGKNSGIPSYIWDEDGSKITEDDKKLERFKGVWEKIFTISEEDNTEFDRANEVRVLVSWQTIIIEHNPIRQLTRTG